MKPGRLEMEPLTVSPADLLFDPNNPRYQGDIKGFTRVPRSMEHLDEVQEQAFDRMLHPRFKVRDLADSIAKVGYLPVDRIVAVESRDEKYVVVEGNRRLAAIRLLQRERTLPDEHAQSVQKIPILLLRGDSRDVAIQTWLIQGVRHVGGTRPWGPYQQAIALETLIAEGLARNDAAEAFGLSTTAAGRLVRALSAYRAFADHPDYRSKANPAMFSFFDELVKRPGLREYYGWNQRKEQVDDFDEFRGFINLICPVERTDEPKLRRALEVRELARVYRSPTAMEQLESPGGSLAKALVQADEEHDNQALVQRARALTQLVQARHANLNEPEKAQLRILAEALAKIFQGD